ncbi:MAG: TIM barrel protein [Clostridia bacterium]|nr:TIM barrel protein [Clostridia bacterium]
MINMVRFGPSGNPDAFYAEGFKNSEQMPQWLSGLGLKAYEYSCARGVRVSDEKAEIIGNEAKKYDISLSIHSPYYINLATDDEEKRQKSIDYIIDSMRVAKIMGADRVVVHSGSCAKMPRETAMEYAKKTLTMALDEAVKKNLEMVHICPETMGKINQLGNLEEVMELCLLDKSLIPTIDFGHLHTRGLGCLNTKEDFENVVDTMENMLGKERAKVFHVHFSRIEFTAGGEKKHWTYDDVQYGPSFDYLAQLIHERELQPRIICESLGTMAKDAITMKNIYLGV